MMFFSSSLLMRFLLSWLCLPTLQASHPNHIEALHLNQTNPIIPPSIEPWSSHAIMHPHELGCIFKVDGHPVCPTPSLDTSKNQAIVGLNFWNSGLRDWNQNIFKPQGEKTHN